MFTFIIIPFNLHVSHRNLRSSSRKYTRAQKPLAKSLRSLCTVYRPCLLQRTGVIPFQSNQKWQEVKPLSVQILEWWLFHHDDLHESQISPHFTNSSIRLDITPFGILDIFKNFYINGCPLQVNVLFPLYKM